ncbi:MAG: response regulator, partial [Candidatus Omnitrophica bacterium]|nr:response regulator [Candidatus Omnitrophota bacterium]
MKRNKMGKILIVDDEKEVREVIDAFLKKENYKTLLASDGTEAIKLITESTDIDVMILDNKMPGLSGLEVLSALEKNGIKIPTILLTGSIGVEDDEVAPYQAA